MGKGGSAEEVPAAKTKKTKKVMRRLPQDYVDSVLAMKPKQPARFPPGSEPKRISEECRRQSAKVNELIRGNEDHIRSIQEYYRRELDTKGYVEVEVQVEVSDDGF
jgi:hypothetical protein